MKMKFKGSLLLICAGLLFAVIQATSNLKAAAVRESPSTGVGTPAAHSVSANQTAGPAHSTSKPTPEPLTQEELDKLFLPAEAPKDHSNVFSIVFNGYRRSQLEPCGCISKQLGGIDKEARLVSRIDNLGIPNLKVDAGGFVRQVPDQNSLLRTRHLLGALGALKYDAINVGFVDLSAGLKFLREQQTTYSLPLISANIVNGDNQPLFEPYRIVPVKLNSGEEVRVGIIGTTRKETGSGQQGPSPPLGSPENPAALQPFLNPESRPWVAFDPSLLFQEEPKGKGAERVAEQDDSGMYSILDPEAALRQHLSELRSKSDVIVLLDYETRNGAENLMQKLGEDSGIDVIVAGEYATLIARPVSVAGAQLVGTGFEGKHVGHMIVEMRGNEIASVSSHMIEVLQSIPPVKGITRFIDQYKKETASLPQTQNLAEGHAQPQKISYAGVKACASCHPHEFAQWQTTRHAKAMQTLMAHNSQFNPDCLRCHTTGYQIDNGFKDLRSTPLMADVQCEVCHGPAFQHVVEKRREHIATQMGKPTPPSSSGQLNLEFDEQFCSQCHDAANDNKFLFDRDIELVNHTRQEQRPEDAPITRHTTGTAVRESLR